MIFLERIVGNGYVFAFAVAGARRLGKFVHSAGPKDALLAAYHALYVRFEVLIGGERQRVAEVVVTSYGREPIFLPVFGVTCTTQQGGKLVALHRFAVVHKSLYFLQSMCKILSGYGCEVYHCYRNMIVGVKCGKVRLCGWHLALRLLQR